MIDRYHHNLKKLGLRPGNERHLLILPVLWIAWADGTPTRQIQARLVQVRDVLIQEPDGPSDAWLSQQPERGQVQEACRLLERLAYTPDDHNLGVEDLEWLMMMGDWVARANPRARRDTPGSPSPRALRARAEIETWLKLSVGDTWGEVLSDLRPRVPSSRRPTQSHPDPR